jgi:hypothetical protein
MESAISDTACSLLSVGLDMRVEIVKLTLGNDALTDGLFIIMAEDGCRTMGPISQSLGCFLVLPLTRKAIDSIV